MRSPSRPSSPAVSSGSVGHLPGDVLQDLAPLPVPPERARCPCEPDIGKMIKQRLGSRGGVPRRLPHGRTDPNNTLPDIPALKDVLYG
jgi:hypothetical protein